MTNAPTPNTGARPGTARDIMLNDIGNKWNKFSREELSALETNDELVTQIVDKYGIEKVTAQRDVDTLMAGRHLKA